MAIAPVCAWIDNDYRQKQSQDYGRGQPALSECLEWTVIVLSLVWGEPLGEQSFGSFWGE